MTFRPIALMVVFLALFLTANSSAQTQPAPPEQTISGLADHLASGLRTARANRVLVLDLRGPQNEIHPVGKWVADQLSAALQSNSPELVLLGRTQLDTQFSRIASDSPSATDNEKATALGRAVGADAVVQGSYAKVSQRLGVTLTATNPKRLGPFIVINAALPISDEMVRLSSDPLPTFKNGILRGGVAATPSPVCIYCPNPEYTDEARSAKFQGEVLLEVTVNSQGRVDNAVVLRNPGYGLGEKSIDTVKTWQFQPPVDLDGHPATISCKVEVAFHLLRGRR